MGQNTRTHRDFFVKQYGAVCLLRLNRQQLTRPELTINENEIFKAKKQHIAQRHQRDIIAVLCTAKIRSTEKHTNCSLLNFFLSTYMPNGDRRYS